MTTPAPNTCCICGCELPNRYAVGDECGEADCGAQFCQYHARNSNVRCREHGYEPRAVVSGAEPRDSIPVPQTTLSTTITPAKRSAWSRLIAFIKGERSMNKEQKQKARNIMNSTLAALNKAGVFAGDMISRLKKDDSPEAMLKTLEEGLEANRARREQAAERVETLHSQIVEGKKALAAASPARRKIVEAELRSRLAGYKSAENQLSVLLENERVLSTVQGRLLEVVSYGLATVTEDQIDDVVDRIEEAVSDAEGRLSATRDLEKAGKRRDREQDTEQLMDELAAFDDEPSEVENSLDKELTGFDETPTPAATAKKPEIKEEA